MLNFLELVEGLQGKIAVPQIANPHTKMIWVMGRNHGADVVRSHVRHNMSSPLPWLTKAPKGISKELGEDLAKTWLDGYNAAIKYVEMKVNVAVFNATGGQAIATR
jgi:hypothetical protein